MSANDWDDSGFIDFAPLAREVAAAYLPDAAPAEDVDKLAADLGRFLAAKTADFFGGSHFDPPSGLYHLLPKGKL